MDRVTLDFHNVSKNDRFIRIPHTTARQVDRLRNRMDLLSGPDRSLMEMVLEHGLKFSEIARLTRQNESTIGRRFRKLKNRLLEGEFCFCLQNRHCLSEIEISIARDFFLNRHRQKDIARRTGLTIYQVKKIVNKIRVMKQLSDTPKTHPDRNPAGSTKRLIPVGS